MIVTGDLPATTGSKNSSSPARRSRAPPEVGFRDGQRRYTSADVDPALLKRRIADQRHYLESMARAFPMDGS